MIKFLIICAAVAAVVLFIGIGKARAQQTTDLLLQEIAKTADGLIYVSETDAPVEAYIAPRRVLVLNTMTFRYAARIDPNLDVTVRPTDEFFNPQINRNLRWQDLQDLLSANLHTLTVFRIGRVQITYYAVGLNAYGRIIGVKTFAIET